MSVILFNQLLLIVLSPTIIRKKINSLVEPKVTIHNQLLKKYNVYYSASPQLSEPGLSKSSIIQIMKF